MPELSIPKFDGADIASFGVFWDAFQAMVGSRTDVPDSSKLTYLRNSLEGAALDCVKSYKSNADGYTLAVAKLDERYGGTRPVVSTIIRRLVEFRSGSNSVKDQRAAVDYMVSEVETLEQLGVDVKDRHVSSILVPLMTVKIRPEFLKRWELHVTQKDKDLTKQHGQRTEFRPQLSDFFGKMDDLISAEESSALIHKHEREKEKKDKEKKSDGDKSTGQVATASAMMNQVKHQGGARPKQQGQGQQQGRSSTSAAQGAANNQDQKSGYMKSLRVEKGQCIFCGKDGHESASCPMASTLEYRERWNKARANRVCFLCLQKGHAVPACQSGNGCSKCGKAHHVFLHE